MSSLPKPNIGAWERDEHQGHYRSSLGEWLLLVQWTPNKSYARGYFHWEAKREADAEPHVSPDRHEELEAAMVHAELFAMGLES